jgi:hypothetical protein
MRRGPRLGRISTRPRGRVGAGSLVALAVAVAVAATGSTTLAPPASATTGCTPGANQIALFTATSYGGTCANYSTGAYPSVSANGGIADNSAKSVKIGTGAIAVLHENPSFGGTTDDRWQTFAASDANLGNDYYQGSDNDDDDVVAGTVSSLWVLKTGCTPGIAQVALFELTNYGGGCAVVGVGTYASMIAAGLPNDFVGSLKVGTAAQVTIYKNTSQGGTSCAYAPGQLAATLCIGDNQASSITVAALPPTTSATIGLTKAVPGTASTEIAGGVTGTASTTYTLSFYADATCGTKQNLLGTTTAKTNASGFAAFDATVGPPAAAAGSLVSATATEPSHTASSPSTCITAGPDNTSWPNALPITLDGTGNGGATGTIDLSGQARWYKFTVAPGEKLQINLTNLPANDDLAMFSDIGQAFVSLNSTSDLQKLSAQFAPSSFAPSSFAPSSFAPSSFAPSSFAPSSFAPSSFAPSSFAPSSFAPSSFAPSSFAPSSFANFTDTNGTYEAAQATSLIAYSAADGTASEQVVANTWNNTGVFYVRVTGRNGVYTPGVPFSVGVHEDASSCASVAPNTAPALLSVPVQTGVKTLILTDTGRMSGSGLDTMSTKLAAFKVLPQVGGAIVDVGSQSPRVAALFTQADGNAGCVYAENLVADAIHDIVTAYRAANPGLSDIVLVGNDHAIPFFRYPDASGLGTESNYIPPVADQSASQAALRLNYVLSQDAYGADTTVQLNGIAVPVPDLPVGRLVETPAEISGILDAYMTGTTDGAVTPSSSLVTGYDFLAGTAQQVQDAFSGKLGAPAADSLISPQGTPLDQSWNADMLRTKLLGSSHGLIFLAGHFSADNALAADYSTTMGSSELAASSVNLQNSIIFSAGCHAGYNIVDGDAIPNVTQPVDWVQAFAQKQATVIAGTGYQYGDTDFIAYSAKLYAGFAQDLVAGGTVAVGDALVQAKQQYLAGTPQPSGIDLKAVLETTLYGLPMLGVTTAASNQSVVHATAALPVSPTPVGTNPGAGLGLSSADEDYAPTLTTQTKTLTDQTTNNTVTATYLQGPDGTVTAPGAPALPLQSTDVTVPDQVLRGVGFRSGTFSDTTGITPLTGDVATDLSGSHAPFVSGSFFPERLWTVNYFEGLADGSTSTELMLTPAQYVSDAPGSATDDQRAYSDVGLRLFYSANRTGAALAAPPTIARVDATSAGGVVTFKVHVVGDPAAGIQGVWITYLPQNGTKWQSLDLTQDATDTTLWSGTLATAASIQFMVQAVNGVGLVTLDTNAGVYYQPNQIAPALQTAGSQPATSVALGAFPASAPYGSSPTFSATLTSAGSPVAGKVVSFTVGNSIRSAVTNASGAATVQLPLINLPAAYTLKATLGGDAGLAGSSTSAPLTITALPATLSLGGGGAAVLDGTGTGITATLTTNGAPLPQRTIEFVLTQGGTQVVQTRITDPSGVAALGIVPQALSGTYSVQAVFGPGGPTPPTLSADPVYTASSASGASLTVSQVAVSSITLASANPTNAGSVSWMVTFNDSVSGVSRTNFSLSGGGGAGASITAVGGSGSAYTVTASTGPDGALGLSLSTPAGITDGVGGALGGTFTGPAYTIDKTPPTLQGAPTSSPNGSNGSYTGDVTIHWTCSDALSGIPTPPGCPADSVITGEGTGLTSTRSVSDAAGNTTTASSSPAVNIVRSAPSTEYLHAAGSPAQLTLSQTAPTGSTDKSSDSGSVQFLGGNPWSSVGVWTQAASGSAATLRSLGPVTVWVGLKNSDDQGTQFDVRAELYVNSTLVASGTTLCISGVTRNQAQAEQITVTFASFPPAAVAANDQIKLKLLTRIGTNPDGTNCSGHANATGLRVYYDSTARPAALSETTG